MRSIWKGAIQFGLVTIPVKLYTATEAAADTSFHMLHRDDLARIQMKVYCPVDGAIIERSDTVKGYEVAPDQYVVITEQDLESVQVPTLKTIDIKQFVKGTRYTRFADKTYFLEPEPIGRKVYALLKAVLAKNGLTAIAKIAIRDRESLAAIDVLDGCLLLTTLQWPEKVRASLDLGPDPELTAGEMAMGEQLVAAMTGDFDAESYTDGYRAALMTLINAKAAGAPVPAPMKEPAAPAIDLMAALQASVAAASKPKGKVKKGA
jgi:DNA end-binding protein Ku